MNTERTDLPTYIPIGLPHLPRTGSWEQFEVIKEWVEVCDNSESHSCRAMSEDSLPARVVDVGDVDGQDSVRLHCKKQGEKDKYLALSHRWGNPRAHESFYTDRSNFQEFQKHIDYEKLPKTFQDAVDVTRELGIRFLWIDSLCIIQDEPEDWETQSVLMEDVFNSAYYTIAASCAEDSWDGFLKPRPNRKTVPVRQKSGDICYVCESIDDFRTDVEEGHLSRRGWVLQERALSRRTIYFAANQVYWECGNGVYCETLTKMRNPKSAFLGDPEFPKSAERLFKGGRIRLYEEIYKRYSRLAFTQIADRAVAISGLENRLIRTFNTTGRYGAFEEYLGRSLLWQRDRNNLMCVIEYPTSRKVPSWSWMAYDGEIAYIDVPFGKVHWFKEIRSHFRRLTESGKSQQIPQGDDSPDFELSAVARDLRLEIAGHGRSFVLFDVREPRSTRELECVVIARDQDPDFENVRKCYILVISSEGEHTNKYKRVGAGVVEERCVDLSSARPIDLR
ncbi:MAG: hypothetical protein Q9165_008123 [Trypethelium subeluteriae]